MVATLDLFFGKTSVLAFDIIWRRSRQCQSVNAGCP